MNEKAKGAGSAKPGATSVQAVAVALEILEELSRVSQPMGVSEIARRLNHTKARVYRHLVTLRTLGFVEQDASNEKYRLGWKIYRLGMSVAENFGLRQVARRHLQWLNEQTGQTVALAMLADGEIIVVDALQSTNSIAITIRPGSVIQASSSALGRAVLAFATEDVQDYVLSKPISRLTEATPVTHAVVEEQLERIRQRWFEVAVSERLLGVTALSAPIFDDRDQAIASIGIISSPSVISEDPSPALVNQVQNAARRISEELSSTAWRFAPSSAR